MTGRKVFTGRTVAVAGASGLLGSHVATLLAARGARVRAARFRNPLPPELSGCEDFAGDLRDPEAAARFVAGAERLYICTGVVGGAGMIGRSVVQITQTLTTATQLMEAAALAGVPRAGLVSSTTVYPLADHPLTEEEGFVDPPFDGYFGLAWLNRALEKVAEHLVRTGALAVAVIRPTSIYGPNDRFGAHAHVLPNLIDRALAGEDPFTVWGDGTAVRDFVHAADVARALVDAVEQAADARPFNIGSGQPVTIAEAVEAVLEAVAFRPSLLRFDAGKPTAIPVRRISIERARARLAYAPCFDLRHGLADVVRWRRRALGPQPQ
ncbi:NAD-dependent epimerase/dehydratase family protein [Azospirillum sp. RWY-5-1]|uniref:NAD-dependent epimerase/dehydratase family protein n=1 Tax=Azospirillum oleiclasticum TaxID=2735135 RepID=A0ABX2TKL6_9PROT|nr:NAD-dependent epimerase/dehydratase family protein [Azospirillum oleiclasticum]NYZ24887.1 NAD-dependent epimerase/dehydratase family protein [Azospirillum oleiclasticum]